MPPRRHYLLFVLGLALALRLYVALMAPYYWDEGYLVELARSLAHGRGQIGALWQDGFFPLSTSFLAPFSAVPFAQAPDPMLGVRLWALGWELLCVLLLYRLGRRLGGSALGLLAALAYAVQPFAVAFGGRAFYHHPAVAFVLLGLLLGLRALEEGKPRWIIGASLALGAATAACYWLWWLPLSWLALVLLRQRRSLPWALIFSALMPLLALALNVAPDPAGARWSIASLLQATVAGAPHGWSLIRGLGSDLFTLSFLSLGLAGLVWAARRRAQTWAWPGLILALAILEPVRQRGAVAAMAYPYQVAAAIASLGVAWMVLELWESRSLGSRVLAAALALLWLRPIPQGTLLAWSADPERVEELAAFFQSRPDGGLICGLPGYNWALQPGHPTCDPNDVGLGEGRRSGSYLPGAPASRLARPCAVADLRYAVVSRDHVLGLFKAGSAALSFLEMEREGWPLVFQNPAFKVYENPRFGAAAKPGTVILGGAPFYAAAAAEAQALGRVGDARFAWDRAQNAFQ
jgi:hypothetical protein